ncbi:hypothetical protein L0665_06055 [Methanogenium marinum]|uniref:Uncharacterized protein n=1 Tax=Methanogenium marinum TaxID=348610 RepID=A0A9Q4PX42_9EURY|nr:hypothetical protein [Methanogenium marinum]MDE4908171.1 hypothetical protein [Methanogenium marinum]
MIPIVPGRMSPTLFFFGCEEEYDACGVDDDATERDFRVLTESVRAGCLHPQYGQNFASFLGNSNPHPTQ